MFVLSVLIRARPVPSVPAAYLYYNHSFMDILVETRIAENGSGLKKALKDARPGRSSGGGRRAEL
jgi:hypothetical protein